jgi:hypothetical protein
MHAKDSAYLILKGFIKIAKDTLDIEEEGEDKETLDNLKKDKLIKSTLPKENKEEKNTVKPEAILPDEKKKPEQKDSINIK